MKCTLHLLNPLIIVLSFLAVYSSAQITPANAWKQYTGNYIVYGCYLKTPALNTALSATFALIRQLIDNLSSVKTSGDPIFNAFFPGLNPQSIIPLLEQISAGSSLYYDDGSSLNYPVIICADPSVRNTIFILHQCLKDPRTRVGMIWDLQFVYLCPSFFSIPLVPSPDQCPQLVAAGTRLGETYLMETQTTILLRELVTLYLKWHQGPLWDAVNEVMTLPVEEAVNNPGSYAWYAA
ncbi:hypothetical protein MMC14_010754, partial [Varicellaria rhodocarpa]|nr:hypothetical protein [Varicellaria rhodocarpa]